jgi:Ras-related protein Rab-6A
MERVATVTSSYYKFSEAAILIYSVDNPDSFNSLAQHLLEVASFAENAKIFLCGNKTDLTADLVSNDDVDSFWYIQRNRFFQGFIIFLRTRLFWLNYSGSLMFSEQCGIVNGIFKTSCKTGDGVAQMFDEIARVISTSSRSRHELLQLEHSFKLNTMESEAQSEDNCMC